MQRGHFGGERRLIADPRGQATSKPAIATLVAMTLSQGHQPPRNSPTGSRSLSF